MQLNISIQNHDKAVGVEISEEVLLHDFKAYVEAETDIAAGNQILIHNNKILSDDQKTLSQLGISDGDLLLLSSQADDQHEIQGIEMHSDVDQRIEASRLQALANPLAAEQLHRDYPRLSNVLHDRSRFKSEMLQHLQTLQTNTKLANNDDPQTQAKILDAIRQQRIQENLELAFHIAPESFVDVTFLYIKLEINGHEAYGLVDSGAQKTTIHSDLAEKFGISDLIDTRFATMTVGAGTQESKGRIHNVAVKLGETNVELPCSFTLLDIHVGILIGLDMLRRHKCSIDLNKDALVIGGQEIKFLTEAEILKHVKRFSSNADTYLDQQHAAHRRKFKTDEESSASCTQQPSTSSSSFNGEFSEESIAQITSLGFSREEAVSALKMTNGNVEMAASSLF